MTFSLCIRDKYPGELSASASSKVSSCYVSNNDRQQYALVERQIYFILFIYTMYTICHENVEKNRLIHSKLFQHDRVCVKDRSASQ